MEELLLSPEQMQLLHEDERSLDEQRRYLSTPDLADVSRDFSRQEITGMPNAQREDGADPDVAVIHGEDHSTTPPRQSSTSQGLRGSSDKRRNLKRALSRQRRALFRHTWATLHQCCEILYLLHPLDLASKVRKTK